MNFYFKAIFLIVFTLRGIESAVWKPPCPHECLCTETAASSTADGWNPLNKTVLRSVICVQQHDTDFETLLARLPPQTEAMKIIQAPDAPVIRLRSNHFRALANNLKAMSLQGVPSGVLLILHSDSLVALTKLQYLSLEHVELLDTPSSLEDDPAVQPGNNASQLIYLHPEETEEILPYEVFKELQAKGDLWDGFTPLRELQYLHIFNCKLPDAFTQGHSAAFSALSHLKELIIRSSQLRVRLETSPGDLKLLQSLSLADNELLDVDLQGGMEALGSLDLSGNQLTRITESTFPLLVGLELLDLSNNPLDAIYANAFVNVSSIRRLHIGAQSNLSSVEIRQESFNGLTQLEQLWIGNARLDAMGLNPEHLKDLLALKELRLSGSIVSIEPDTFSASRRLQSLDLKRCQLRRLSVDAFQSLSKLKMLDLSHNELNQLPPGLFDPLYSLKELWLNHNRLATVPADVFSTLSTTKLIRLDDNPWHCTCQLRQLKETAINKVKVTMVNGVAAASFQYERRVAPLCATPEALKGESIFDAMRKQLKCSKVVPIKSDMLWSDPLDETVDHGPEADEDAADSRDPSPPLKYVHQPPADADEIDHGEEIVQDAQSDNNKAQTPVVKRVNEVWTVRSGGDPTIMSLKSSFYLSSPTLSKKSLKLRMEEQQQQMQKSGKKYKQ